MKPIDQTVKKETLYITGLSLVLSVLMQAVFLVIGKWELRVLFGNLLGLAAACANFFLMGLTVQKALGLEAGEAKAKMKLSQNLRMMMLFAVAAIGFLPVFHPVAVVIPFLFPRVGVTLRMTLLSKKKEGEVDHETNKPQV